MALTAEDIVARCRGACGEHTRPGCSGRPRRARRRPGGTRTARSGPVDLGGITALHVLADLTVLRVAWTPGMALYPHEHRMWAVIGMYGGQEDNAFYRRAREASRPAGGRELPAGEVLLLGDDAIHSVANSRREFAVALHVYGGDFFAGRAVGMGP